MGKPVCSREKIPCTEAETESPRLNGLWMLRVASTYDTLKLLPCVKDSTKLRHVSWVPVRNTQSRPENLLVLQLVVFGLAQLNASNHIWNPFHDRTKEVSPLRSREHLRDIDRRYWKGVSPRLGRCLLGKPPGQPLSHRNKVVRTTTSPN